MDEKLNKPVLVKDINPGINREGSYAPLDSSSPKDLTQFNGKLYFSADDGKNGRELWVSDGTTQGTNLVKNIHPGNPNYQNSGYMDSSIPTHFIEFDNKLYFSARDSQNNSELWVTDGTTQGTKLLAEIGSNIVGNPQGSAPDYGSDPDNFTKFNGKLYFAANDRINGDELWVTDGTTQGTNLVIDICPIISEYRDRTKPCSSSPRNLIAMGNKLYFTADDGETGRKLWVSDGTKEGTNLVKDIDREGDRDNAGYLNPQHLTSFNNKLYFTAGDDRTGRELWVSDGTEQGTSLVKDINLEEGKGSEPDNFTEFNNKLYFSADDGENGRELWATDGTEQGTTLVADLYPSPDYFYSRQITNPDNLFVFNDRLYFTVGDRKNQWEEQIEWELWATDGTKQGTERITNFTADLAPLRPFNPELANFVEFDNKLYFTTNNDKIGKELWMTDGTTKGTQLVVDFSPDPDDSKYYYAISHSDELIVIGNQLFFTANDAETGTELYKLVAGDRDVTNLETERVQGDRYSNSYFINGKDTTLNFKTNTNFVDTTNLQYLDVTFLLLNTIFFICIRNYVPYAKK